MPKYKADALIEKKKREEKTGSKPKSQSSSVTKKAQNSTFMGGGAPVKKAEKTYQNAKKPSAKAQRIADEAKRRRELEQHQNQKMYGDQKRSTPRRTTTTSNNLTQHTTAAQRQKMGMPTAEDLRQGRDHRRALADSVKNSVRRATSEENRAFMQRQKSGTLTAEDKRKVERQNERRKEVAKNTGLAAKKGVLDAASGYGQTLADVTELTASSKKGAEAKAMKMGYDPTDKAAFAKVEEERKRTAEEARKTRLDLAEKQEKRQAEFDERTKNAKGLEKAWYGAVESGTGMAADTLVGALTGTGTAGSLASMAVRTYGTTRGQAEKEGATENEDRAYAMFQAAKEVGTELMFPGAGLAKKAYGKAGLSVADRVADSLTKGMTGNKADLVGAGVRLLGGTAEENAEELAGWGLDPIIKELTYGKKVRTREAQKLLKQESDELRSNLKSAGDARSVAAYLGSDRFLADNIAQYKDAGLSDKQAREVAEKMRDYLTASLTGDTDRMGDLEDEIVTTVAGGSLKAMIKDYDVGELMDTFASTSVLTLATGLPATATTAMKGAKIRENLGSEGLRALSQTAINFEDDEASLKGQAARDRLDSGKDLTSTQVFDLAKAQTEQIQKDEKRVAAMSNMADNAIKSEKLVTPKIGFRENGSVAGDEIITMNYVNESNNATEIISDLLKEEGSESLTDTEVQTGSRAIAGFKTGAFTVNDANALNYTNTTVRTAFEAATGVNLSQYVVRKNGQVDIPATNAATKDALFAMAADNFVKTAQAETANWMDSVKGDVVTQVTERMGAQGSLALQQALDDVDERDRSTYMMNANAADMMYQTARNMGTEWDSVKAEARRMFPDISETKLEAMYNAGLRDRADAANGAIGQQVRMGEAMSLQNEPSEPKGKVFVDTTATPKGTVVRTFSEIANNLGVDIHLVDDLKTSTGGQANGQYVNGAIYINMNSDFESNIGYIFMHEVTHHLKQYAPEQFNELENLVREKWFGYNPEQMQNEIAKKIDLYKRNGQTLSEEEALEEIIADAAHEFINDRNFADQVAEQNPDIAKAILNGIRNALRMLRRLFAAGSIDDETHMNSLFSQLNILDEAEKLWLNAYTQAVQNKAAAAIDEWQDRANRHSIGYHAGDLGKSTVDDYAHQGYSRGTGHFGFGTYFVGNEEQINYGDYGKRKHETVDFDKYNLATPRDAERGFLLHDALKRIDGFIQDYSKFSKYLDPLKLTDEAWDEQYYITRRVHDDLDDITWDLYQGDEVNQDKKARVDSYVETLPQDYKDEIEEKTRDFVERNKDGNASEEYWRYEAIADVAKEYGEDWDSEYNKFRFLTMDIRKALGYKVSEAQVEEALKNTEEIVKGYGDGWRLNAEPGLDSGATVFMKQLGYEGVDVRHIKELDNTGYGSVIYDLKGEDLARKQEIGTARFSITTDKEDFVKGANLSKELRDWAKEMGLDKLSSQPVKGPVIVSVRDLRTAWYEKNGRADEANVINTALDKIGDSLTKLVGEYQYIDLGDALNAAVTYRTDAEGHPTSVILSCQVKNAEYEVNFDFTTICAKRLAMQKILERFIKTEGERQGTTLYDELKLDEEGLYKLRLILETAGFEVSCRGCFVEQNRYSQQNQARTIANDWNAALDEWAKDNGTEVTENFGLTTLDIDNLDYEEIEAGFERYHELMKGKKTDVATKNRMLIEASPFFRKRMNASDYASMAGQRALMAIGESKKGGTNLYGLLKRGQSDSKQSVPFTAYNGEISLLPDNMKGKSLYDYLLSIGGARAQSASDFQIEFVYDYMQMVADLSARGLPMHMYTKVIELAELFGMTGIKINLSAMCDVAEDLGGEYAGLKLVDGKYEYNISDQSIDYEKAVALQKKDGYSKNIGIIMVTLSSQHMLKSLDDPDVRYIIGYHSSAMPVVVANMSNMGGATDYTKINKTNKLNEKGQALFDAAMEEAKGNTELEKFKDALRIFDEKIQEETAKKKKLPRRGNEYGSYMSAYGGNTADFNTYDSLLETKDARKTADKYLEYCMKNDLIPIYFPFAFHKNYYKCEIYDFNMYDNNTGEYAPMESVQNIYPDLNMAAGETDTTAFTERVSQMMDEQNRVNKSLDSQYDAVFDEAKNTLKYSISGDDYMDMDASGIDHSELTHRADAAKTEAQMRDDAYMDAVNSGDMETAQRLVDEAAKRAGMRVAHRYHGTMNAGFTVFDKAYAKVGGNSGAGFYFSTEKDDSVNHYADVEGADNYFKWSSLAEHINDQINEGTWEGPELETYEDVEEYAKEQLNKNPGTYDVYLNYKNPYIRNGRQSTNIFNTLDGNFDDSAIDRNDYDSEDDYDDAWHDAYYEHIYEGIYNAVYGAYSDLEDFYDILDAPDVSKVTDKLAEHAIDYESLTWDEIENAVWETELIRDDWTEQGYGAPEFARAIIENFGFDAIEDKEVSSKFGQLSREMMTDTEHIIVFKPEQIKLSDPITYAEDGSVIPLSERFDPANNDIRYSLPTTDADGKVLTDGQMEFFKNSQARDAEGRLVPVYHTTNMGGFTVFDPQRSDDKRSLFFTSDRRMSESYSKGDGKPTADINPYEPYSSTETVTAVGMLPDIFTEDEDYENRISNIVVKDANGVTVLQGDSFVDVAKDIARMAKAEGYDLSEDFGIGDPDNDFFVGDAYEMYAYSYELNLQYSMDVASTVGTYNCYLNLENPLIIEGKGQEWEAISIDTKLPKDCHLELYTSEYLLDKAKYDDYLYGIGQSRKDGSKPREYGNNAKKNGEVVLKFETGEWVPVKESQDAIAKAINEHYGIEENDPTGAILAESFLSDIQAKGRTGYQKWLNEALMKEMTSETHDTRDWAKYAQESGYDGVIFKDIIDYGDFNYGYEPHDVYVAFSSNQVKDTRNENPTENPDIRYSITDDDEAMSHMAHDYAYDNSYEALAHYEEMIAADESDETVYQKAKNYIAKDVDEFYAGLTRYADGMRFDDPVLEEGRTRMAKSKQDFFNSNKAKWNDRWLTDGEVLDIKSVEKAVRDLVTGTMLNSNTNRKYSQETVKKTLIDMRLAYFYAKQGRTDIADALLWHSAHRMIDGVEFYREDGNFETYKRLRDYFKDAKLQLGEDYWSDVDYAAFRKMNFGRLNLVRGKTNLDKILDDLYHENSDGSIEGIAVEWFNPEAFEKNNYKIDSVPDILLQIADVLDTVEPYAEAYSSEYCAEWATDIASDLLDIMQSGKELQSTADKYKKRYDEKAKAMKARHAEAMLKVRQQRDEGIKRERVKFKEYVEKKKEKQAHNKYFDSIQKSHKKLTDRLLSNTADSNIPQQYKKELAKLLAAFDLQTVGSKKVEARRGVQGQKTIKMAAIKTALNNIESRSGEFHVSDAITDIIDELLGKDVGNGNNRGIEGLTIDELNSSELARIDKLLKALVHEFNTYKTVKIQAKRQQTADIGKAQVNSSLEHAQIFGQRKDYQNITGVLDKIVNMGEMTPAYMFRMLDPNNEGIGLMWKEIRRSFDRYVRNQNQLNDWMDEIIGEYHQKGILWNKYGSGELSNWRSTNYQQTFVLNNGTVTLTPAQMMSLYCLSKRNQAYGHMVGAGIVVAPVSFQAKIMSDVKKKADMSLPVILTDADIKHIVSKLTPDQIKVADKLQELMATKMAAWGNEASMNVLGIELFGEPDYFPIKSDKAALEKDLDADQFANAIRSFGFTKAVQPGARNAIMIDDIFDVVAEHCNNMNLYNSYSEAMNDFMKVYNYRDFREDGREYTVQQAIAHAYSRKATTYIMQFMKDLNGNVSGRSDAIENAYNTALGNAKKAAVFANLRVAAQQPTAIVRAFAEIDPKYIKGIRVGQGDMKEMMEHCPIALWKSWGYYDINMGKSIEDIMMNNGKWLEDKATDLYGALDNVTWTAIWQMVKAETRDKHSELKEGTDEFFEHCNERMSEIVDFTQVVDSPMHRSHDMRSKNMITKLATSFMAEPTLTFNMVKDGMRRAYEEYKAGSTKKAAGILQRTFNVFIIQAGTVAVAAALVDALRKKKPDKDDEDDRFLHLWWVNTVENFHDQLKLWNNIYFVKDIASMFEGWDNSNLALQGWKSLATGWNQLTGNGYVKSSKAWYENMAYGLGYLTGIPAKTMMTGISNFTKMFGVTIPGVEMVTEELDALPDAFKKEDAEIEPESMAGKFISTVLSDNDKSVMDKVAEKMGYKPIGSNAVAADKNETKSDSKETKESSADIEKQLKEYRETLSDTLSEDQKDKLVKQYKKTLEKEAVTEAAMSEDFDVQAHIAEAQANFDYEMEKRSIKAAEMAAGKTGRQRDEALWDVIADGYTKSVESGNMATIQRMREEFAKQGGNTEWFDAKIADKMKSAYKKTLYSSDEIVPGASLRQETMYNFMTEHGVSETEISDIVYHSYVARDLKAAMRIGNEDYIMDELVPLVAAGLSREDYEKLYKYRNMGAKTYDGKYTDQKYTKTTGTFVWPTEGVITSHFGWRNAPTAGASSNHPAIDIGAPSGTTVVAADGGVVITAGANGGYGNSVGIKHANGMVTYYNHLSAWNVKVGDQVAQGQPIANVGSTGISTGPHLDFKILDADGNPVDPEKYLNKRS